MEQQPDEQLITQVLHGNTNAYAALVNRYQSFVFTLVLRYIKDRHAAEEVAQDVFVKAYRNLGDFKGNSKFSTWLYTIAGTTALSQLRKNKDNEILPGADSMALLTDNMHAAENADGPLYRKNKEQVLNRAMEELPDEDAQIILLFYKMQQTLEETGNVLGLTAGVVKTRLFRARLKLKKILESRYVNELK